VSPDVRRHAAETAGPLAGRKGVVTTSGKFGTEGDLRKPDPSMKLFS